MSLAEDFGVSGWEDPEIAGVVDEIVSEVAGSDDAALDVGASLAAAQRALTRRIPRPKQAAALTLLQRKHAARVAEAARNKAAQLDYERSRVNKLRQEVEAERARLTVGQASKDADEPNMYQPWDSGDTLVAAGAETNTFTLEWEAPARFDGISLTTGVANNFVFTEFKATGFTLQGLGVTATGNGTGAGMSLAMFVPENEGRRGGALFRRKVKQGAKMQAKAKNVSAAPARFTANVLYYLDLRSVVAGE